MNVRLIACLAGYQIRHNNQIIMLGDINAELIIEWLKQCKFEIVDMKVKNDQ